MDSENESGFINTALALQALKTSNYSDTTVLYQAINFLVTNQNADGGWAFVPGGDSNAYVTATVQRAISAYSSTFNVQTSIQRASAYLLTKQNTDGGFATSTGSGQGSSNVYETALSFLALIQSGQGSTTQLQNAVNYLTSAQLPNGSWNDDPYSTALVLQVLANVKPNLSISSSNISLSKSIPAEGESVTITATIRNTGLEDALGVTVRFFQGDPSTSSGQVPSSGEVQIGNDQIISSLAFGSSAQVAITHTFTATGSKTVFVQIDPENLVSETTDADNIASAKLWVATLPDLAVFSEDLKPSTYVPASGTPFTVEYTVRNLGESSTGGFDVALYDGDPSTGSGQASGTLLQTVHISGLAGAESRTGTFGVTLTGDGAHTLYLMADAGFMIQELSETNNTGSVTVQVGGVQQQADLVAGSIILTPSRPTAGETVQIAASVRNQGIEDASSFTVELFDGAADAGGTLIASQTVSLAAGAEQAITTNWIVSSGIHDLYVIADRANQTIETNETNNTASLKVMTDMVDISLSATDLTLTPNRPVTGDSVVLSITAHNLGIRDTGAFSLALYDGPSTGSTGSPQACSGQAPDACGMLLQTFSIANIPGDGSVTLTYTFTAEVRTYRFYAVADTENAVVELDENNNLAIRSLTIKGPGETYGPDLVPVKIDLSSLATDSGILSVTGTAQVTFQNKGDDKITSSFGVLIFEDTDLDARYTPGVDTSLGTGTYTNAIWPEGAGLVNVPLTGTVKFLHSPLYAMIDSGDAIAEQSETNNLLISCADCEKRPANPIEPVMKWKWQKAPGGPTHPIMAPPAIINLTDDNADGTIDELDIPDIVFVTQPDNYIDKGFHLRAFKGNTGEVLFNLSDPQHLPATAGSFMAAGDIDHDGKPELVTMRQDYSGLLGVVAYEHDGTFKWDDSSAITAWNNKPKPPYDSIESEWMRIQLLADLDADGTPEIVIGTTVINADGSVKCSRNTMAPGERGYGSGFRYSTVVADLDMDGRQEILAGNTAYNADCTLKWINASTGDGLVAVGNFDDDIYPEIVLGNQYQQLYLLEHNGTVKWGPVNLKQLSGAYYDFPTGHPVVADFDGDGKPEIGIRAHDKYFIFDRDGRVNTTLDFNCGYPYCYVQTAPTVFDLNGDGRPEVLANNWGSYSDNGYFKIFDGRDGTLLYQEQFGAHSTMYQTVVVADVDNDGHSEVVVFGYSYSSNDAIRVYKSKNNDWVPARKIWNQPSYHVTNVNDDGTIPQYESPSWLMNNTYRTQARVGQSPNPYLTPNLTASRLQAVQMSGSVDLSVRIGNGGAKEAQPGAAVTFYDGPSTGSTGSLQAGSGQALGTASTTRTLQPGEYQDLIANISGLSEGLHHLYAVVDSGNTVSECDETDNQTALEFTVATGLPDLKVALEDIILPAVPYAEGAVIPVTVNVRNIGSVTVSAVTVRLYNGNPSTSSGQVPSAGGVQIGSQTVQSISAGGSASAGFAFDTLGHAGTNVFYVVVDQENVVIEANETNNTALITLDVQAPSLPNLAVTTDGIQTTPATPGEGDKVTIKATVMNRGATASNIPVRMSVRNAEFGVGNEVYAETKTIYPIISLGQSASVSITLDTTGFPGQQNVFVTIDPANTIVESSKDDNTASKALFIQSAGLTSSIALDKTAYQANETVTAAIAITTTTATTRLLTADCFVTDTAGNRIATITQAEPVTVGPNSTVTLTRTWNTGKTLAGNYHFTTETAEEGKIISRTNAGFSITPDKSIQAKVTTDKIAYNPNESAALSSTVTSLSGNYIQENLTAKISIQNTADSTQVYTETKTITTLMPGASYTFKYYWNTGTYAPGPYTATLEVLSGATVLNTSTASFELLSSSATGAGTTGTITASPSPVYQGREETVTYSITNNGNEDMSGLTATVLIVDPETEAVKAEYSRQYAVGRGETTAETQNISTSNLAPRTYLAVLQTRTAGMSEPKTLASAVFEVKPGIEVTRKIPDVTNLLVWLNADCGLRTADCGLEKFEEALKAAATNYHIVNDKKEFQEELRNPIYTDIMVLGDFNPVEDHISEELREQVYAGRGLITSLFNRQNLDQEVFGIKVAGNLAPECGLPSAPDSDIRGQAPCGMENRVVEITGNDLGIQGSFPSSGEALRIEAQNQNDVIAWITSLRSAETSTSPVESCGTPNEKSEICNPQSEIVKYPAAVKRQYGQGNVMFFAFDLGMSAASEIIFKPLVTAAIASVHSPIDTTAFRPNWFVPVEITIKSLGAAFDIRVVESYPEELKLYDPEFMDWLPALSWTREFHLDPDEQKRIITYALTPDKAGTFTLRTEAGYLENGAYIPYQDLSADITVEKDSAAMTGDLISALDAMPAAGNDRARLDQIKTYIQNVQNRAVTTGQDREQNIHDLVKAADALFSITGADVSGVRPMLDNLLQYQEAEWYYHRAP